MKTKRLYLPMFVLGLVGISVGGVACSGGGTADPSGTGGTPVAGSGGTVSTGGQAATGGATGGGSSGHGRRPCHGWDRRSRRQRDRRDGDGWRPLRAAALPEARAPGARRQAVPAAQVPAAGAAWRQAAAAAQVPAAGAAWRQAVAAGAALAGEDPRRGTAAGGTGGTGSGHLHRVEEHRQDRDGHRPSPGGHRDELRQRDQVRHHLPAGGPGRRGEVPDPRLGRGWLLSRRPLEPGRHGRNRVLGILHRRRRHAGQHERLRGRARWEGVPRLHHLGHRREWQVLQRVLPEPRDDEDRRRRLLVRWIDGRECLG